MFTALLVTVAGAYLIAALGALVILLVDGRRAFKTPAAAGHAPAAFLSVLVAARNEENALPRCLSALQQQDYPSDRIEFIIADDHSSDATASIISAVAHADPRFRLVQVPDSKDSLKGKAHALHEAFLHAHGDILLTTDADCTPPPGWARALASTFSDSKLGIACGVTTVEHATMLDRLQALDWLLLLAVASAASSAGFPLTAMGNNMAFRREAYLAVGGYPGLPFSVTEDYAFFQAVHRTPGWNVRLILDRRLRNNTLPLPTLRQVFAQRKRWARGGLKASPWAYLLYLTVFFAHVALLLGLFVAPGLTVPLLVTKCAADLAILSVAKRRLGLQNLLSTFPLFELYLFAYVIVMPFALLITPETRWKNRSF